MSSPTNSFDLDAYERMLDRKKEGRKWKRRQNIVVDSIEGRLVGVIPAP